jgi:hypothetical protein
MAVSTVDGYIKEQSPEWQPLFVSLRALVKATLPKAVETLKWGSPCYMSGERSIVCLYVIGGCVNLGFFQGAKLEDPERLLEGDGAVMRQIKIRAPADILRPGVADMLRRAWGRDVHS